MSEILDILSRPEWGPALFLLAALIVAGLLQWWNVRRTRKYWGNDY